MAKGYYFLTWQLFFALIDVRASEKQNVSNFVSLIQSTCPSACFCSPCPSIDMPEGLALLCSDDNRTLEDFDMAKATKICSLRVFFSFGIFIHVFHICVKIVVSRFCQLFIGFLYEERKLC